MLHGAKIEKISKLANEKMSNVDATEELNGGLCLREGGHGGRNGQCYKRFFHE